jgi:hypothetical protein
MGRELSQGLSVNVGSHSERKSTLDRRGGRG